MKQHDKPTPGNLDESAADTDTHRASRDGGKPLAARAKPARKPTFAAFLKTIPPGDAYDDQDFARVQ
ncbi:hypothetical protein [Cupriavidus pauculus]|uniref:Uncharacterized protein n=1 Tax=Cupriavidus pauculus TaxID=82633 RepID=A0A2N5C3W3_9BURK|nr:hypothetical protein [Cupriavidus pauculus]PLP96904.1 hypothetical protein CYJ10_30425 [Cupriavidus pauculus]